MAVASVMEILTSAQMRAVEQAAIESGSVSGGELMGRAGRGVVAAMMQRWPDLAQTPHRAAVFCGPGNNGGDGFVIARLLTEQGWQVTVFFYGAAGTLPPDARDAHGRWAALGAVHPLSQPEPQPAQIAQVLEVLAQGPCIVVDALFGTGLGRPVTALTPLFEALDGHRCVAVDIPSGLCADSGRALSGVALRADLTVSFHRAKCGHVLSDGPELCGQLEIADIGLDGWRTPAPVPVAHLVGESVTWPVAVKSSGHKFSHGHALCLAGGVGRGGAGRLAARGALRIGAGAVTLICPPAALQENAMRLDAIMVRALKDTTALRDTLVERRATALCLGPGLGLGAREADLLRAALAAAPLPLVLDADALTLLAKDRALLDHLHPACVLTPHDGEFARVFPDLATALHAPALSGPAFSRIDATRAAAARVGCVVLLKGADTVIADPSGRVAVHCAGYERAVPWLATAGAGDVLAGFITGLLARGFSPFDAACGAARLHVDCALEFGPGLIAEDLPEMLPRVLARLDV